MFDLGCRIVKRDHIVSQRVGEIEQFEIGSGAFAQSNLNFGGQFFGSKFIVFLKIFSNQEIIFKFEFQKEILQFQLDKSVEVKKFVINFIEEAW